MSTEFVENAKFETKLCTIKKIYLKMYAKSWSFRTGTDELTWLKNHLNLEKYHIWK